jgi:hypothetical protein
MSLTGLAEVPDWATIGLGAGPPLAIGAADVGRQRAATAATAPADSDVWAEAVRAADIPATNVEARAIDQGSVALLEGLAKRFAAAANGLTAPRAPIADHLAAVRSQLGLLVRAEAMRAAQVSELAGAGGAGLKTIARSLAALGDAMWDVHPG